MSLAERRTWTIPPDDLPKDAVIDFGRRQNWETQQPVSMGGAPRATIFQGKGEIQMKIAVAYQDDMVFQHFGHTEQFKLYDVENGKIVKSYVVETNGQGHGALAGFLKQADTDVLICGGIGGGARTALKEVRIQLFVGVSGKANEAVHAYLVGNLGYDPDVHCDHHEKEHSCGDHGCREDQHGCAENGDGESEEGRVR